MGKKTDTATKKNFFIFEELNGLHTKLVRLTLNFTQYTGRFSKIVQL